MLLITTRCNNSCATAVFKVRSQQLLAVWIASTGTSTVDGSRKHKTTFSGKVYRPSIHALHVYCAYAKAFFEFWLFRKIKVVYLKKLISMQKHLTKSTNLFGMALYEKMKLRYQASVNRALWLMLQCICQGMNRYIVMHGHVSTK